MIRCRQGFAESIPTDRVTQMAASDEFAIPGAAQRPRHGFNLGCAHLPDDAFLEAVRSGNLPLESFHHADHLRLAWLYLHRLPWEAALQEISTNIRQFGLRHGKPHAFHETVTVAWVRLLSTHTEKTFDEFLSVNEAKLKSNLLHRFWSPELLNSPQARTSWVEPDLNPLPDDRISK